MIIRPRIPPHPDIKVGLDGWISWQLLNRDGTTAQHGEQHNLILDQGLDAIATHGIVPDASIAPGLQSYLAVGTGTAEVNAGNTALANEVARTSSNGGISNSLVRTADGVYEQTVTREFTEASVGGNNLSEFGLAPTSTQNLSIRELFRDGLGSPIVITPDGTQKLRITHTLRVTLGPVVRVPVSVNLVNFGPLTGSMILNRGYNSSSNSDITAVNHLAFGSLYNGGSYTSCYLVDVNTAGLTYSTSAPIVSTADRDNATFPPYVTGSHQREWNYQWGTTLGNFGINTISIGFNRPFIPFSLDTTFFKDNLHTLSITGWSLSWGRA